MPRSRRFTIGEGMIVVAAIAVACAWPVLMLPIVGLLLVFVLDRLGFSPFRIVLLLMLLGLVLGLALPPIHSHR